MINPDFALSKRLGASFLPRFTSQYLSPMEFWVLAGVAFGLLIWGHLADCTDSIGRELN